MDINIQLDGGEPTQSVDSAVRGLERLQRIINSLPSVDAKLAGGSSSETEALFAKARAAASGLASDMEKVKRAMASMDPSQFRDKIKQVNAVMSNLITSVNALSKAKWIGPGAEEMQRKVRVLAAETQGLANDFGAISKAGVGLSGSMDRVVRSASAAQESVAGVTRGIKEAGDASIELDALRLASIRAISAQNQASVAARLQAERAAEAELQRARTSGIAAQSASTQAYLAAKLQAERTAEAELHRARTAGLAEQNAKTQAYLAARLQAERAAEAELQAARASGLAAQNTGTQAYLASRLQSERAVEAELQRARTANLAAQNSSTQAYLASRLQAERAAEAELQRVRTAGLADQNAKTQTYLAARLQAERAAEAELQRARVAGLAEQNAKTQAYIASRLQAERSAEAELHRTRMANLAEQNAKSQAYLASRLQAERAAEAELQRARTAGIAARSQATHAQLTANLLAERAAKENEFVGPTISHGLLETRQAVIARDMSRALNDANAATRAAVKGAKDLSDAQGKGLGPAKDLSRAFNQQTIDARDLHSAYRGLASGFGAMWLTWGRVMPLLAGAAVSHSMTSAVKQGMAFGDTLTTIGALAELSAQDVERLNDAILTLGKNSVHGPQDMADALKSLALAGLNAYEQLEALPAVLDFSLTGERPLKDAAEDMVAISTAFGMGVEKYRYVGDVISKTAAASMASVSDMSAAFRTASTIATTYRVDIEDVAVGLALMAQAGIRGQAAGTGLRQMYVELTGVTKKTAEALERLNISIFDDVAQRAKPLPAIIKEVADAIKGLSFEGQIKAIQEITNERGMRALGIQLQAAATEAKRSGKDISSALDEMVAEVGKSAGFMEVAADRISGSTSKMTDKVSALLKTQLIAAFQDAEPAVRDVLEELHRLLSNPALVDSLSALIELVASLSKGLIGLANATTPLDGHFMTMSEALTDANRVFTIISASVRQLYSEITATLAQLWALVTFRWGDLPKIKGVHDEETAERARQLQADLAAMMDRAREAQDKAAMSANLAANAQSALGQQAAASLDSWANSYGKVDKAAAGALATGQSVTEASDRRAEAMSYLLGVTKDYQSRLESLHNAWSSGDINQEEYVAAVSKLAKTTWEATDAGRALAAAAKSAGKSTRDSARDTEKEADAYRNYVASLQEKIEAMEGEREAGRKLTAGEKEQLNLEKLVRQGKLSAARLSDAEIVNRVKKLNLMDEESRKTQRAIAEYQAAQEAREEWNRFEVEASKAMEAGSRSVDSYILSVVETSEAIAHETSLIGLNSEERTKALAVYRAEVTLRKKIAEINATPGATQEWRDTEIARLKQWAEVEKVNAAQLATMQEAQKNADQINSALTDALLRGFESGKGFAENFRDTIKNLFRTLVLRPVISFIVQPLGNFLSATITGLLGGGGAGGSGGIMGMVNNASSAYNFLSGGYRDTLSSVSNFFGFGGGSVVGYGGTAFAPTLGSTMGSTGWLASGAAMPGYSGTAAAVAPSFSTPAAATSFGGAGWGAAATAAGVLALPIAAGLLAGYLDKGDTFSGAAFATSDFANDRISQVVGGALNPNVDTGDLPDREALMERLRQMGASDSVMSGLNDRTLHRMMLLAEGEMAMDREGGAMMNWSEWGKVNAGLPDFYRGQGYAFPEGEGWWEVQDKGNNAYNRPWDSKYVDPTIVAASRELSLGILAPFDRISEMLGQDDTFRVASGMAQNDKTGNIFGGLSIRRGEEELLNWGKRDFETRNEYLQAAFSDSLSTLNKLDLPEWAKKQVDGAKEQISKLEGDDAGQRAAEIFAEATNGLVNMYGAIKRLIDTVPEFSGISQDAVYNITTAMGGLDQFASTYSSYVQNFWKEAERFDYIQRGIEETLSEVGLGGMLPDRTSKDARQQFRELVEQQDLSTESGQRAFAALMQVSSAFAEITQAAEDAASSADSLSERVKSLTSSIGSSFTDVLKEGLLGNLTGADLGGAMADAVIGGVYNAIASNAAQQITDLMMTTVVDPIVKAAIAGTLTADTVSQDAIAHMVASAQAAAEALNALFNSEAFQSAMTSVDTALRSISSFTPATPYYTSYATTQQNQKTAAERAAEAQKKAEEAAEKARNSAFDALQRAIDAEKERVQTALEAATTLRDEVKSLFDYLSDQVKDLRNQVLETLPMQADAGRAFIEQALAGFRATGVLPELEPLQDAVSAVRKYIDEDGNFASMAEENFARLVLAGQLDELRGGAEAQLTHAEQQIALLEAEMERLDEILETAKNQLDALRGVDTSVLSVAAALNRWTSVVGGASPQGSGNTTGSTSSSGTWYPIYPELRPIYTKPVPAYAIGTNYVPFDQLAMVHEGEAIVPKEKNPSAGYKSGDDEAVKKELAEVKSLLAAMLNHVSNIAAYDKSSSQVLVGWAQGQFTPGVTIQVEEEI